MFHSATVRLTAIYLSIIMLISLFFSGLLYQTYVNELRSGLRHQIGVIQQLPRFNNVLEPLDLRALEAQQIAQGKQKIAGNLILTNLFILILAGVASYWLARLSLRPIEETMESQSRFTADASHELRTPLTAMRTEIEVALRNKKLGGAEARHLLTSNLEEVERLQGLAERLLQLARQEPEGSLELTKLPLDEIIKSSWKRLSAKAQQKQITFESHVDQRQVYGNEDYLVDLFTILFDNSIKYGKTNGSVTVKASGQKNITISIADNGQGIRASDLPHVFDRFYRGDTARSRQGADGFGLGLPLAKQIVDIHSGSISIKSHVQKGTEVLVTLPS